MRDGARAEALGGEVERLHPAKRDEHVPLRIDRPSELGRRAVPRSRRAGRARRASARTPARAAAVRRRLDDVRRHVDGGVPARREQVRVCSRRTRATASRQATSRQPPNSRRSMRGRPRWHARAPRPPCTRRPRARPSRPGRGRRSGCRRRRTRRRRRRPSCRPARARGRSPRRSRRGARVRAGGRSRSRRRRARGAGRGRSSQPVSAAIGSSSARNSASTASSVLPGAQRRVPTMPALGRATVWKSPPCTSPTKYVSAPTHGCRSRPLAPRGAIASTTFRRGVQRVRLRRRLQLVRRHARPRDRDLGRRLAHVRDDEVVGRPSSQTTA